MINKTSRYSSIDHIINNFGLESFPTYFNWIVLNSSDPTYLKIKTEFIDAVYSNLEPLDKKLLLDHLVMLINFIQKKFHIESVSFRNQLFQNNLLDLRAILNLLLPYIEDDATDSKNSKLKFLSD